MGSVCACSSSYTREEAKQCLPSFSQTSSFCEICSPPAPAQSEEYCDILRAISAGEFFFHIFNLRTRQHFKALQPRTTSIYYNYGPSTRAGHALQIKRTTGQGRKHAALCTVTVAKGTQTRTLISTGTPSSPSLVNKHKVSGRMNRGIQQMDDMMPKKWSYDITGGGGGVCGGEGLTATVNASLPRAVSHHPHVSFWRFGLCTSPP